MLGAGWSSAISSRRRTTSVKVGRFLGSPFQHSVSSTVSSVGNPSGSGGRSPFVITENAAWGGEGNTRVDE
eukprot:914130-Prorocentrum_minimum.AAC.1